MNAIKDFGIDLAKSVFQVCVWMNDGSIAFNRKVYASVLDGTSGSIIRSAHVQHLCGSNYGGCSQPADPSWNMFDLKG